MVLVVEWVAMVASSVARMVEMSVVVWAAMMAGLWVVRMVVVLVVEWVGMVASTVAQMVEMSAVMWVALTAGMKVVTMVSAYLPVKLYALIS